LAGLRIAPHEVGPFVKIATVASERQVLRRVISSVLPGIDVFDMEFYRGLVVAMHAAVFAAMTSAFHYQPAQRSVH